MRTWTLAMLVLGACSPEIVTGAYLCGPDESCPDGQTCNGVTALCVSPSSAQAFTCGDDLTEIEPNNGAGAAQAFPALACASTVAEIQGCTPLDDSEDWFGFDVPPTCSTTVAHLRISSSIAWESLGLELSGPNGTFDATACSDSFPDDGTVQLCLDHEVTAGAHYTVRVSPAGDGNCDGACSYNRYRLGLQLGTR